MKKTLLSVVCACALMGCDEQSSAAKEYDTQVKVLTANLWHDLEKGYDVGLAEMRYSNADVILTQESDGVNARLANDLNMHYWQGREGDASVGILSKFPIIKVIEGLDSDQDADRGGQIGAVLDVNGREVVVWDNHLDWKQYTAVEPRGMDGNSSAPHQFCLPNKLTADELDEYNAGSKRPEQMKHQNAALASYMNRGVPVLIGGDFNEPTGLDWKDNNLLFDRTSSDYDFSSHRIVREAGFVDSFRQLYADTNAYPGITWPVRNNESWTKAGKTQKACGRAMDDRDRIDFIYFNQNAQGLTLDKVAFVGPRYSDYFKPVDGHHPDVYQTKEPHEGLLVNENGEPQYSESTSDFPSDHLWYSASFSIKTPQQYSKATSLDLNPRFSNIALATDGSNLTVGFNIENWQGYEEHRHYSLFVAGHANGPRDSSGGSVKIETKPNDDHPLAITVSNAFLQQLKKAKQKLQLRLYANVAGSPKIFAAGTITMKDIEDIVTVDLPPEPEFHINNGEAVQFDEAMPVSWRHATENTDQWIGVYKKGDSISNASIGWVYANAELDASSSLSEWQTKPNKGSKIGDTTLPSIKVLLKSRAPELGAGEYDLYLFAKSNGSSSVLGKTSVTVKDE